MASKHIFSSVYVETAVKRIFLVEFVEKVKNSWIYSLLTYFDTRLLTVLLQLM